MQVTDEDDYLIRNMTIKTNRKIVTEQIWIRAVTSEITFQPFDLDTDAQLHDVRIITVREERNPFKEFKTARANVQEVRLEPGRTLTLRFVVLDSWLASTEELAGMDMLCSDKTGTRSQSIVTIESKLPWCKTLRARVVVVVRTAGNGAVQCTTGCIGHVLDPARQA